MKKSMYQAIRLFLFSLLLPLLGLIFNSLRLFNPEILYNSPVLFIGIAHVFGLTTLVLYSIVVNQKTLENLEIKSTKTKMHPPNQPLTSILHNTLNVRKAFCSKEKKTVLQNLLCRYCGSSPWMVLYNDNNICKHNANDYAYPCQARCKRPSENTEDKQSKQYNNN